MASAAASGIAVGASIEKEPEDFNAKLNEVAKFSVTTFPQAALVQWYKVGTEKPVFVGREFKINNVSLQDVGYYYCAVGEDGAVISKAVALMAFSSESKSNSPGILSVTVPVSVPYPGSGYGTTGPCGSYIGVVRFPRPGSNPPSYNWVPPSGRVEGISLKDLTAGPAGYQSSLSILQNYPPVQLCQAGPGPLYMPVVQGAGYSLWLYVVGPPKFAGTVISAEVTWVTKDLATGSAGQN